MAEPKDDVAASPPSAVDALFQQVDSWSFDTLGQGGVRRATGEGPLPNDKAQPLSGWSLFESAAEQLAARAAAAAEGHAEPESPSIAERYAAHERAHDSAGNANSFVDPASLILAVYGAPHLEPANVNIGSLSAMSQLRAASAAEKAPLPAMATNAVLGTGDAILSNGSSLYQGEAQKSGAATAAGVWKKLWRY